MIRQFKFWFIFLSLIIVTVFFFFIIRNQNKKSEFKTTTVKRGDLIKSVSASGKISSQKEVELKFQTSGQLVWVGVKEGDYVSAWQAVAQLDQKELYKNLRKSLLDYSKERWDFDQEREERNITSDDLNKYTLSDEVRRVLEKNQFDLEKAVLDAELKDIALKYATLITPISGIVTRVDTPVAGVNITPATAVFTVSDPNSLIFNVEVDEADIGQILINQNVKIDLDAYSNETFEGKVEKIAFQAKATRGGGTAFNIEISLPKNNQNLKFKLGMNGDVEIIIEKKENVLFIPEEALVKKNGKKYVWIVENGMALKRDVDIGLEADRDVEITSGITEDENVVTSNLSKLKERQKIN